MKATLALAAAFAILILSSSVAAAATHHKAKHHHHHAAVTPIVCTFDPGFSAPPPGCSPFLGPG
jgi:hypothetical protein